MWKMALDPHCRPSNTPHAAPAHLQAVLVERGLLHHLHLELPVQIADQLDRDALRQ